MLEFSVQQFPFRFGLSEGIDPHQVPPGTLTTAENACWRRGGRLEKRLGVNAITTSLIGGGNLTSGVRLFSRGAELCLVDGASLYSYSPAQLKFRSVGAVPEVIPTWSTAVDTLAGVATFDVTYASGMLFYGWSTGDPWNSSSSDVWFQVVDATTGQVVYAPTASIISGPNLGVRVLYDDVHAKVILLTRNGAASPFTIKAASFDLATLTFSAPVTLKSDVANNNGLAPWDAHLYSGTLVIGYNRTGAIIALETYTPTAGGGFTAAASGTVTDANGCTAISVHGTPGESLYVAYVQGTAIGRASRLAVNNPSTLAAVAAASTLDTPAGAGVSLAIGVTRYDSARCAVNVTVQEASLIVRTTCFVCSNTASITTTVPTYWSAFATSRPFMVGSKAYMLASLFPTNPGQLGANSALLTVDENRHLGLIDLQVGGISTISAPLASACAVSSTVLVAPAPYQSSITPTNSSWRQGLRTVRLNAGASKPTDAYRAIGSGGEAYVVGGCLTAYDGGSVFDYGFATAPVVSVTTSGVGGSIAAGTYLYSAVSEFRSRTGLLYRSPAAIAKSVTTAGATSTNTVLIQCCNLVNKPRAFGTGYLTEGVFRSTVGGSVPQRLSFEPRFNTVYVDYSQATQTLSDTRADSSIDGAGTTLASRAAVYTTGGILDDFQPPAGVTSFAHVDRLWVLAGDGLTWWYSKAFQDDLGTAPGFHPNFRIVFAETQTAGASMDDKAIFYSASGISYMLGTGPGPNGLNSDFQTPIKIQTDVGCTNPRSLVSMPDGHMFQSARGIYLLTRGLELVWIGRPVKDTLAAYPIVTSAVLVASANEVRFTTNTSDGSAGVVLVYNYVEKQWSTFRHWSSGAYGTAYADACLYNGQWAFVTSTGVVNVESTTSYLDSLNYVPMTLETAWISGPSSQASPSAGPLKFQSVRNMSMHGTSYTDHDLTIQVGFDSEATYAQTATWLATTPVTTPGSEEPQIGIGTRRKCNSIRFKVSDATPSSGTVDTGRGPAWDMMGLEVGIKRGFSNTPATKKG